MTVQTPTRTPNDWLKRYYFARAGFSIAWVAAAFLLANGSPAIVGALLLIYPAWDAAANIVDARRTDRLTGNSTQIANAVVSAVITVAIATTLARSSHAVLATFGAWAILSGLLQLATGVRRRRGDRGQWPMMLSGAQSAIAGAMFVVKAWEPHAMTITTVAPYAAFGAFYFLIAALWLTRSDAISRKIHAGSR